MRHQFCPDIQVIPVPAQIAARVLPVAVNYGPLPAVTVHSSTQLLLRLVVPLPEALRLPVGKLSISPAMAVAPSPCRATPPRPPTISMVARPLPAPCRRAPLPEPLATMP